MSKIGLIIKREYTTRVMKPSFIILTFLTPILITALVMVPLLLSQIKDSSEKTIVVVDQTGLYKEVFKKNENYVFEFLEQDINEIRESKDRGEHTAVLYISEDLSINPRAATLFSEEQIGIELKSYVSGLLKEHIENQKIEALNIPDFEELVEQTKVSLDIKTVKWGKDGEEKMGSAELALMIGMLSALVIYMFIVIYGAQVMSGVVQEKTNRIVEVIISSVKPFELMMGKIIGIAMVGLTQFLLWMVLSIALLTAFTSFTSSPINISDMQQQEQVINMIDSELIIEEELSEIDEIFAALQGFDFLQTAILFVLFFLGGYLLYASLFAAIGSAVDNETDTQQFSMPLMIPIIFAVYAAIYSANNPDGPLAFWCSMIPFTSPIVMMVRLPFGVAFWEIALSLGILILSFIGSTWLAGKIYRTGILMYGKKITWKEMIKWISYRN